MFTIIVRQALRRNVNRCLSSSVAHPMASMDSSQAKFFLNEICFLVNDDDKIIGTATKKECHTVGPVGNIPLHRGLSVYLFNKKGDLLLQQRSSQKITYPNCYSNTCCSHPLFNYDGENEEKGALGIKRAAQRRLNYELGIPIDSIPLEKFNYITRIKYTDTGNGQWGEREIAHILFLQDDVVLNPNYNEVSAISFIPKDKLNEFLLTCNGLLTPWFDIISKNCLNFWWDNLHNLDKLQDHSKILDLDKFRDHSEILD